MDNDVDVPPALSGGSYLQTLSRGIRVLEHLGSLDAPPTATQIAAACDLPKPVIYRLLTTLKAHNLIRVDGGGRYALGYSLISLARKVDIDFRNAARDLCAQVATELNATTFIWAQDGDQLVCTVSIEPARSGTHVRWREGMRQPLKAGASSAAILSTRPSEPGETETVSRARERGYATSTSEVESGIHATAVPILEKGECRMCVAVLTPESAPPLTTPEVTILKEAASRLSRLAAIATPNPWTWAADGQAT